MAPKVQEMLHENEARVKVLTEEWAGKWKEMANILQVCQYQPSLKQIAWYVTINNLYSTMDVKLFITLLTTSAL